MKYRIEHPTVQFLFHYLLWVVFLFLLVYFEQISPLYWINTLQTDLSIYMTHKWLSISDLAVSLIGNTLFYQNGLRLYILDECNGLIPYLLLAAAILAHPSAAKVKLVWLVFAYMVMSVANILRLESIISYVVTYPENFIVVHHVAGRIFIAVVSLLLFYFYVYRAERVSRFDKTPVSIRYRSPV